MKKTTITMLGALAMVLSAAPAFAHLTHDNSHVHVNGFAAGMAHPVMGLDHLLAMVAVGLLAAQRGGRMLWAMPAMFVGLMLVGGAAGMAGLPLPLVEGGIAASVIVLGVVLAAAVRMPSAAALGMVGAFALFHGYAHGTELPTGALAMTYSVGFAVATAVLHAVGIAAALGAAKVTTEARQAAALRLAGATVACAGVLVMTGVL